MAVLANMVSHGGVPPGLGSDSSAAANIANIANLAMRLGVTQVSLRLAIRFKTSIFVFFVSVRIAIFVFTYP